METSQVTFDDFVGNHRVLVVLRRMLASGRIPHALLFAGQQGVGKFTLATLFTRALNCQRQQGAICDACENCRALSALDDLEGLKAAALSARGSANPEAVPLVLQPHPSVSVLVPDGAFIRVAQMRHLVRQAYAMPAGARHNVFLIDQAEKLRFDYADVLLKVLEEPPERTTLILVTAAPFELRATIRSRSVPLFFAPLGREEIQLFLKSHRTDLKKSERELAAAAAAGSLATALRLDLQLHKEVRGEALELLRAGMGRRFDPERLFAASALLAGKTGPAGDSDEAREAFEFSLDMLYSLLTDILHRKAGASEKGFRHPDLRSELERLAGQATWPWLSNAVKSLDSIKGWQRRNVNRQLALDAWTLTGGRIF
jgi:DNA polymerase-3 subunit delta'